MEDEIIIEVPYGLINTDGDKTVIISKVLLTAAELENVKKALEHGEKLVKTRLDRIKKSETRFHTEIEQNTINSAIDKAEHCKAVKLYKLELLDIEIQAIIYCLEHSKNAKSKEVRQLIDNLETLSYTNIRPQILQKIEQKL